MNILRKLFKKKSLKQEIVIRDINIGNIKDFDDVWVKIEDNIFDGWVLGRKSNVVSVVYCTNESLYNYATFTIERPLNRTEITENNITLLLINNETNA